MSSSFVLPNPVRTRAEQELIEGLSEPGLAARSKPAQPPGFDEIEAAGRIAPDGRHYENDDERRAAARAKAHGLDPGSVQRSTAEHEKSPDAALVAERVTVELKLVKNRTRTALVRAARRGRHQSSRLFVSGYQCGLPLEVVREGLAEVVAKYGADFAEILIEYRTVQGNARAIHWR